MAKHLRPQFDDYEYEEEELNNLLRNEKQEDSEQDDDDDDDFGKISFGALKNAQDKMDQEDGKSKSNRKASGKKTQVREARPYAVKETRYDDSDDDGEDYDSGSDSEGLFEEEDNYGRSNDRRDGGRSQGKDKKKSKHAPTEASSKKKPSKIRQIPGLDNPKYKTLYKDIRFDAALGKADLAKVRKDYKFLDDYRQNEIQTIQSMLKNPKVKNKMSQREIEELEYQSKSLKSRLESLKNKDMQQEILKKYKDQNKGTNGNKFYLKKSEERKIIQKHKFENMKASEREKVMERKRKRRLGKEFKQLEFNRPRN